MKNGYHCAVRSPNQHTEFYPVNRSESVTNFQGNMELYCLNQESEIFAKSVLGALRAVFDSELTRLT
jgi:hypothetical protein